MYFLRALYREGNPMAIAVGLAILYFLLNGVFGSKSEADKDLSAGSVVAAPTNVVKEKVSGATVDTTNDTTKTSDHNHANHNGTKAAPVQNAAREEVAAAKEAPKEIASAKILPQEADAEQLASQPVVATNDTPTVEVAESAAAAQENSTNENSKSAVITDDVEQVAQSVDANEVGESSIFSRIFKRSAEEKLDQPKPEVVASAAAAASAIAAAPVIAAARNDEDNVAKEVEISAQDTGKAKQQLVLVDPETQASSSQVVEDVTVESDLDAAVELEKPKKSGGFLGLFGGNKDKSADVEDEVVEEVTAGVSEAESKVVQATETEVAQQVEAEVAETTETEFAQEPKADLVQEAKAEVSEETAAGTTAAPRSDSVPPPPAPAKLVAADMGKLADARRAFWNREYGQADALYNELISAESSNPDLLSEYGNMLLQSGQVEKTLNVYEQAATLMIEGDRKQDARPLIDYISSWDQNRADQLINKVFAQ